jgi:hypothetical protein
MNNDPVKELDEGQKNVLRKIEALLRVADKGKDSDDPHTATEAASAAAKAQELLVAYNLDASMVGGSDDGGTREEQKLRGGFYLYQRQLWASVAELNFCLHFMSGGYHRWTVTKRYPDGSKRQEPRSKWEQRHRLIGRKVNVRSTISMATYLQGAIERLVTERLGDDPDANRARWSQRNVIFREGAAEVIREKLAERRRHLLTEERRKQAEAEAAAERAGRADVSTSTALTIASVVQTEADANRDFRFGLEPGTTARQRAEKAARLAAEAERRRHAEQAYTRWAAAHPEEARAQEEARRKEEEKRDREEEARERRNAARRTGGGGGWTREDEKRYSNRDAYYAGRDAAENISLDQQMDSKTKGALTHG